MSAPQTSWAKGLAKDLVDAFRETEVTLVRTGRPSYDPLTGAVTASETTIKCGAAVLKTYRDDQAGPQERLMCDLWFDSTTLPDRPTTQDVVEYQGRRWRIVDISPAYGSGDDHYAYKLRIASGGD